LRILAVSTAQRKKTAPEFPSMTELGYPMDLQGWWAGLVPAATPRPIVEQLGKWISTVTASEEGKAFLASIASDPWVTTPDEAQAFFLKEIERWGEYVRIANIEKQG
jgi:tripartite-type tricarboxylate transporter receptor subunit TctC